MAALTWASMLEAACEWKDLNNEEKQNAAASKQTI
jgi:hypothetical protein